MSTAEKIKHEITAVLLAALYFAIWFGALLVNKSLILAEYHIAFTGFSKALIGALILSKVVLIMEHVPLGSWVRSQPAWIDVFLRTALYSLGVLAVLILEKGFEGRHEHGSFGGAVEAAFRGIDAPHVWSTLIYVTGALLVWNAGDLVNQHLGKWGFAKLFLAPRPAAPVDTITP
jgi:hypothetical protein